MLSLEKVKNGLETFGYEYANNILCGHTKSKVKLSLPTGIVNVMAFEQATSYLFGFSDNGINLFPVHGDWDIADNLFIPWSEITSFKMKNGLLENEMILSTSAMKIEMKINKVVANNSWVKDNLNYLKSKNYFCLLYTSHSSDKLFNGKPSEKMCNYLLEKGIGAFL